MKKPKVVRQWMAVVAVSLPASLLLSLCFSVAVKYP